MSNPTLDREYGNLSCDFDLKPESLLDEIRGDRLVLWRNEMT